MPGGASCAAKERKILCAKIISLPPAVLVSNYQLTLHGTGGGSCFEVGEGPAVVPPGLLSFEISRPVSRVL